LEAMPLESGLACVEVAANGSVSPVVGFTGDRAVLNMQLNDRTYGRESASLVLRSYLIEGLINRRIREVVFWAGTSPPLSYYITHREEFITYVDSRSHPWRLVRLTCVALAKLSPATFGKWLNGSRPTSTQTSTHELCQTRSALRNRAESWKRRQTV